MKIVITVNEGIDGGRQNGVGESRIRGHGTVSPTCGGRVSPSCTRAWACPSTNKQRLTSFETLRCCSAALLLSAIRLGLGPLRSLRPGVITFAVPLSLAPLLSTLLHPVSPSCISTMYRYIQQPSTLPQTPTTPPRPVSADFSGQRSEPDRFVRVHIAFWMTRPLRLEPKRHSCSTYMTITCSVIDSIDVVPA